MHKLSFFILSIIVRKKDVYFIIDTHDCDTCLVVSRLTDYRLAERPLPERYLTAHK